GDPMEWMGLDEVASNASSAQRFLVFLVSWWFSSLQRLVGGYLFPCGSDAYQRAGEECFGVGVGDFRLGAATPGDYVGERVAQRRLDRGGDARVRAQPYAAFVQHRFRRIEQRVERACGSGIGRPAGESF